MRRRNDGLYNDTFVLSWIIAGISMSKTKTGPGKENDTIRREGGFNVLEV